MIALALLLAFMATGTLVLAAALALRRPHTPGTPSKPWWKSKTIWINVATVALAAGVAIEASVGKLEQGLPPGAYLLVVGLLAVVNAALRLVTTKAVTLTGEGGEP